VEQFKIEITYEDESTEEFVIEENKTLKWITEPRDMSIEEHRQMMQLQTDIVAWMERNGCVKIEITRETV
jgi:hypothetical protein